MKSIVFVAIALGAAALTQPAAAETKTAIFAGGCFWCVEADFDKVPGVTDTLSGYTGGTTANPTYEQVGHGNTGHREAVQITYDTDKVTYEELLTVFWHSVDPTDAGGQFCDRGETYATAIFVADEAERVAAEASKAEVQKKLAKPIVTPILDAGPFYAAEDYHQNYHQSQDRILSRFGYITKEEAYKGYRKGCGRDARLMELWGEDYHKGIPKE